MEEDRTDSSHCVVEKTEHQTFPYLVVNPHSSSHWERTEDHEYDWLLEVFDELERSIHHHQSRRQNQVSAKVTRTCREEEKDDRARYSPHVVSRDRSV